MKPEQQMSGCGPLLLVTLIALKLAGVITWPWWLVFAPVWLGLVIVGFMLIFGGKDKP